MELTARPAGRSDRISSDVTDIGSADQLLSFALAGQLERLRKQRGDLSQGKVAEAAGLGATSRIAGPILSRALRTGPTSEQLQKLDDVIGTLSSEMDRIGSLCSLGARVAPQRHGRIMTARVPASWTEALIKSTPSTEFEVLTQASGLLSAFMTAEKLDQRSVASIRERHGRELDGLIRRLILLSASPPTARTYDAQMMLGNLTSYAFELTRERLESAVRNSPLSFRVWRSISKQVGFRETSLQSASLRTWVRQLVRDSGALRERSIYPGASLDLEVALAVPRHWSPPEQDWAGEALMTRAMNRQATMRERSTAAMGLWHRALEQERDLSQTRTIMHELIGEFASPDSRPDAPAASRWVAATLEQVRSQQVPVCNDWPEVDEPWFRNVQHAADELLDFEVPDHLRAGTRSLFLQLILQNAGGYRRRAIETIVTSGLATPVTRALGVFLRAETAETWVRMRAESALGYLQEPSTLVEGELVMACMNSYGQLKAAIDIGEWVPRALITELHTSLFAIGDCFGTPEAAERAKNAREELRPILEVLADADGERARLLRRPARAAAYLLTVTAQPAGGGEADLSKELLGKFAAHPDPVTARLSRWALSFRFASDGSIRSLLAATTYGIDDQNPYLGPN